jgi:hypothetical protein
MLATLRDHAMPRMMVMLCKRVECSAKIAMTTLSGRFSAMSLFPKPDWRRRILLDACAARIRNQDLGSGTDPHRLSIGQSNAVSCLYPASPAGQRRLREFFAPGSAIFDAMSLRHRQPSTAIRKSRRSFLAH